MTDESKGAAGRLRNWTRKRDFYAGTLIMLLGLVAAVNGPTYGIGTLVQMGPGFMPTALGIILILLGIVMAVAAMRLPAGEDEDILPAQPQWRGWACVLAGPILFIVLGAAGGMIPATFGCVFVSALGDREATLKSAVALALAVTGFGVVVFYYLLQVPLPLLAWRGL